MVTLLEAAVVHPIVVVVAVGHHTLAAEAGIIHVSLISRFKFENIRSCHQLNAIAIPRHPNAY